MAGWLAPPCQGGWRRAGERVHTVLADVRDHLALFVQDDNAGPPTRDQLAHYHRVSREMFPNATQVIPASSYDAFFGAQEMLAAKGIFTREALLRRKSFIEKESPQTSPLCSFNTDEEDLKIGRIEKMNEDS